MPCRIKIGVHEWLNEVPAVPSRGPVNPHPGAQTGTPQRGEKTLWSFTAAWPCGTAGDAEGRRERCGGPPGGRRSADGTPPFLGCAADRGQPRDRARWAVWLGWHAPAKVSGAPKGGLRRDRNPPWRARPKARLTGPLKAWGPGVKAGPSEHSRPLDEGRVRQKSYPRGNGAVAGESPHRPRRLLPRRRHCPSWGCSSLQGWGCSPIKGERELGSERREPVRFLPAGAARPPEGKGPSVRKEQGAGASGVPVVRKGGAG